MRIDLLTSSLGQGSSGTVWEVVPVAHPDRGPFALKTMAKGLGNAEGYQNTDEDMAAEVSFLKRLHHPCIGGCIEVLESPSAFYLVLVSPYDTPLHWRRRGRNSHPLCDHRLCRRN